MNSNIYRQFDSRWAKLPYPTKGSSFSGNGCGCCACTHIIIERTKYKNYTPADVRPYMVKQGFAKAGQGTIWSGITKTLQHYGFKVINHETMTDLFTTLNRRKKEGKKCMGVILFRAGTRGGVTWTSCGHYVAFTDYKVENGKHYLYMKDSGGRQHDGFYCYETTMKGLIPQVWSAVVKLTRTSTTSTIGQKILDTCRVQAEWMKNYTYSWPLWKPRNVERSKKYGTCVTYVACVLQRLGYLKPGEYLWNNGKGYGTGKVYIWGPNGKRSIKASDKMVVKYMGNKQFKNLQNELKTGDIVMVDDNKSGESGGGGHIMIFAGKWTKKGNPYIWDNYSADRIKAGAKGAHTYGYGRKVLAIVRLKEATK